MVGHRNRRNLVRKYLAPEGALRRERAGAAADAVGVRKHPAPEGALRPGDDADRVRILRVRKHPAPEGALRQDDVHRELDAFPRSESTQHQKVH